MSSVWLCRISKVVYVTFKASETRNMQSYELTHAWIDIVLIPSFYKQLSARLYTRKIADWLTSCTVTLFDWLSARASPTKAELCVPRKVTPP